MSRYTGPKTRINRRFGTAIFPANKAFERRAYLPGIHGPKLRRKVTDYSLGLNEKQKLRLLYGLTEKQFHLLFDKAKRQKGVTGEIFLQLLEMRLDSVVYLSGFAKTRRAARQMVNHGHVRVNGHKVDIASYSCRASDQIDVYQADASRHLVMRNLEDTRYRTVPAWMQVDANELQCRINRVPGRDEITHGFNEQIVVEFYSR
ncbi:MAG: 30S ribosomal protein S4 [Puniceicoccales bacterium]|jgi:small subunit ribosomal protein S4|nr:30S ribosomal protein S4 [Puniceicoccales bacterium]